MAKQTCTRPRILFVDDEQSIRLTLPRVLARHGFEVTSVANMEDAIAEVHAEKFDVLLSDLNLAHDNDGFRVIEEMRKAEPRCINFVLTGYPEDDTAQRADGHEVAHYFTKPVDIEEMVNTIKQKLEAARL
jgi:two-component system response regulator (stage 0 sporulation protein F)